MFCRASGRGGVASVPYEQWAHQFNAPDFDPTLWDVLVQGETIAAICLNETKDASTGVVEVLGVRPAYRQRGLGGLLLRHAFDRFQQRGFTDVILDVDTENTSNAVALYENAGMRVRSYTAHYVKLLRTP
jgi:mycothiol synthase